MLKSNLNSKLAFLILGILAIGTIYLFERESLSTEKEINNLTQKETAISEGMVGQIAQERVLYTIDKGEGDVVSYQMILSENSTVFSLLEELANRENFKIEFTVYEGMGVLVEDIDEVRNGTDNKYWQYWVNEKLPMVAADKKEIKEGDKVEWKFVPSPF